MSVGVVQKEFTFRSEANGPWFGNLYSYHAELCPQYLSLASSATVSLSLAYYGAAHIVEGDESGEFHMRVCADVYRLSAA